MSKDRLKEKLRRCQKIKARRKASEMPKYSRTERLRECQRPKDRLREKLRKFQMTG
jgi:hypothetical protein